MTDIGMVEVTVFISLVRIIKIVELDFSILIINMFGFRAFLSM